MESPYQSECDPGQNVGGPPEWLCAVESRAALIGMLHIPINSILASPSPWREAFGVPTPTRADWGLVRQLEDLLALEAGRWDYEFPGLAHGPELLEEASASVRSLSFYPFLEDRLLREAQGYQTAGLGPVILENIAGPYFVRDQQPAVVFLVMDALASVLRCTFPRRPVGIQVLAFSDNLAMDIAVRRGLGFVRAETGQFGGMRPEGVSPNRGNLAKLYVARSALAACCDRVTSSPVVLADVHKKHTVFPAELDDLRVWLDNIIFQKLEGIVVTGAQTGSPVPVDELRTAREAIDRGRETMQLVTGREWGPALVVGSGITAENLHVHAQYADALIVGSSLKVGGYWESPLDEERLQHLIAAWHRLPRIRHGA